MVKKRMLVLTLALLMILSLFAGCGSKSDPAEESTEAPTAEDAPPTENVDEPETPEDDEVADAPEESIFPLAETATITMMDTLPGPIAPYVEDMHELHYVRALEEATNVHVEYQLLSTVGAAENFKVMVASEDWPNVCYQPQQYFNGGAVEMLNEEFAMELTDLINDYMPNYKALLENNEDLDDYAILSDGSMALIYGLYDEGFPRTQGLLIREDFLQKVGKTASELITYDDLHDALLAVKTELGLTNAMWMSGYDMMNGGLSAGYDIFAFNGMALFPPFMNVDGTIKYGPYEENYRDYLYMLRDWYDEGLISPDFVTIQNTNMQMYPELIETVGCYSGEGSWATTDRDYSENEEWSLMGILNPVKEEGDVTHIAFNNERIHGGAICITTTAEDPELIARYFDFWFSEEGYYILNYGGYEGETYYFDDNGEPQYCEEIFDLWTGVSESFKPFMFTAFRGTYVYDWRRQFYGFNQNSLDTIDLWTTMDSSWMIDGSVSMSIEDAELYNSRYGDIMTCVQESYVKFIVGEMSLENDWDSYIATLEQMGIQDCIDCYQRAIDA